MKHRILIISFGVACALAAAALVLFAGSRAAPLLADSQSGNFQGASQQSTTVIAHRLISVPFGIQSSLQLLNEKDVVVAGHGSCSTDGERYKLSTTVTQGNTKAKGYFQGLCRGNETFMWSTVASANPSKIFKPGIAEACGMVIVYTHHDGSNVMKWCKDVNLMSSSP
ncbi:MAG: hypothetical protein P8Z00_14920 [Anaerolineales bacterium]|jgi:hypothetical protein